MSGKSYWSGLLRPTPPWVKAALARSMLLFLGQFAPSLRKFLKRPTDYSAWLELNTAGPGALDDLGTALAQQEQLLPLISIIMPVYRPDQQHFLAAIQSVEQQLYSRWELCICDDGNDEQVLLDELDRIARGPMPVRIAVHPMNRGIAAATNSAAALAKGDLLLFLDQDDMLTPDCLGEFALAFLAAPDTDLIYSDSDKLDANCRRTSPSFKPGWSPWLLLSHMYLSHAVALRRTLFEAIGGVASGFEGSQDYDLILRASELARGIHHVSRVLYHWRAMPGSTALGANQKPDSIWAGQAAIEAAFARRGVQAIAVRPEWAEHAQIGLFQPRFPAPTSVSVLVLTDQARMPDGDWLNALKRDLPSGTQILALAPGPFPKSGQITDNETSGVTWIRSTGNLARDFRLGLGHVVGDVTLCLIAGVKPATSRWVAQMCGYAARSVTLVGARVVGPSGKLIGAGLVNPPNARKPERALTGLMRNHHGPIYMARTTHEVIAVTGECLAISQEARSCMLTGDADAREPISLGQQLSGQIQAVGGNVLVCGDVDLELAEEEPETALPDDRPDPWYNPNLGQGTYQFRPAFRSPPVRQKEPVRITVVSHNLDREGAQSTLLDLIEGLVSRGYANPTVISSRHGQLSENLRRMGVPIEIIATPNRKASRREVSEYREKMAQAYRAAGAQAVLANTLESYCAVATAADAGLAALWWQHEGGHWSHHFSRLPLWRQAMAFSAFGSAYRVIQVAEDTRRKWRPIATRENFEVIRPGIPTKRLVADRNRWSVAEARAALGITDDQLCVVLLGSVSRRKSQGDVIRALRQIPKAAVGGLRILIVGALVDPVYHIELQTMLASLPPSHRAAIELTGNVIDAALYLAAADVFLCCSRQESAPRAIVEAMGFGLPVLTTPVDGIPELVDEGRTGFFYQPGDVSGLSAMVQQLIKDRSICRRLSANTAERLSVINDFDAMLERFAMLLREAAWQRKAQYMGGGLVQRG